MPRLVEVLSHRVDENQTKCRDKAGAGQSQCCIIDNVLIGNSHETNAKHKVEQILLALGNLEATDHTNREQRSYNV